MQKIYLLMIALAMFSFTTNGQLVVNGDFEAWTVTDVPDSWTTIETGITVSQESTTIHGGASAMKVDVTTGSQSSTDFRQSVDVEMGKTYDVSVWAYQLDSLSEARLYVGAWSVYSDKMILNQWQELTHSFTATATETIEVGLRFYDQTGFVDHAFIVIDDFTMTQNITAPVIENIVQNPASPTVSDAVSVQADITDNGTITTATLTWTNDGGTTTNDINMTLSAGSTFVTDTDIPAQAAGTTVSYSITAIDNDAEQTTSSDFGYYIGDFCNGDFEAWTVTNVPDCWSTIESGITLTEESTIVHGGAKAMKVDVTTASQGDTDFRQIYNVTAGETYDVSVWVYQLDSLSEARLYFGNYQGYSDKLLLNQWQEVSYQFDATVSEAVEVGLRFYDQTGFVDHSFLVIDDFMVQVSTATNNVKKEALNIFPNPVRDILTVEGENISTIEIMDINGKSIRTINHVGNKENINVSSLIQGIYFVKVRSAEGTKVSKLVKL